MKKETLYAQVVFPLPLSQYFDYAVPPSLKEKVAVGERVRVPFGRRSKIGYIVGLSTKSHLSIKRIKPMSELIDEVPLLDERLLRLSKMIHTYYLCSWGEALEAIFPTSLRPRKRGLSLFPESEGPLETPPSLGEQQKEAFTKTMEALTQRTPKTFLLFGRPGSGKTELILQVIQKYLERDLSSIVLYPEISLTREAMDRFKRRFGNEVCLLHSQLSPLDRYAIWKSLREGRHHVVVGARSAILSPVKRLGLIVCRNENDAHYKQEEVPRYHARTVALMRSELERASVLLESETPSLESYTKAKKNRYTLLQLPQMQQRRRPPKVSVVDMREEMFHQKRKAILSKYLERRMVGVLKERGQILLFLNRRGFSTFIHCRKCGVILRCLTCRVPLKYHFEPKRLICHYCNNQESPPNICPGCRESYLRYTGVGTERIESEVHRIFPEARIARVDADTVKHYGSQEHLIEAFRRGEGDVLVGTQRVARELVPEGISLVGVLSADTLLSIPDFRSAEHAFAMLHQLIRQAAREDGMGEVVIQTFSPQHPVILASCSQDYKMFYDQEVLSRKQLGFPPFRFLAKISFRGKKEENIASVAQTFKNRLSRLKKGKKVSFIGPAPALLRHVKGEIQWQLLVKSEKENLSDFLREPLKRFKKSRSVKIIVDIDPY